jgi:hypothetical protein
VVVELVVVDLPARRNPKLAFVAKRFVDEAVVLNMVVVVALVDVEFRNVTFWRVEDPVTRRFGAVSNPVVVRAEVKRLVKVPVVEKKEVVVAAVPVAVLKVNCCSVVEPKALRVPDGKI